MTSFAITLAKTARLRFGFLEKTETLMVMLLGRLSKLFHVRMVPLVLLFLCVLSYGLLTPWLGFYWDDWPAVWVSHSLGSAGLRQYAAYDRPAQGWLFTWATLLLGNVPSHWHVFALLTRWLSGVAVWWCLRGVWPRRTPEVACVAFLFAVYPGFVYQPVAWIFSQSHLVPLTLSIFSLGATIWARRVPRWFWPLTILAVPSAVFSMLLTEYFFGLELLRPVFLWLVLSEERSSVRQRLRRTLTSWSPYIAATAIFLVWRVLLFKSIRPETDQSIFFADFAASPWRYLARRPFIVINDLVQSSLMAWGQTFRPNLFDLDRHGWEIVLVSAIGLMFYLIGLESRVDATTSPSTNGLAPWTKQAIIVGLVAMCVGALPVWFVGRYVELDNTYSRHSLTTMFGASIFVVGLVQMIIRTRFQQIAVLSIAVALAVGFHYRNSQDYRNNWLEQKSLFWQLSWRAPALKPGTAVLMRQSAVAADDDALAAPLNFLYSPAHSTATLDYWFFHLPPELLTANPDPQILKIRGLSSDPYLKRSMRMLSFDGSVSTGLLIRFAPPSCLRVIDPSRDELPQLQPVERVAQTASHVDRIEVRANSPARPPTEIFGPEPEHFWCYYFEKADLARQAGDWQQVAQMADEARRLGFKPDDATEWLPVIEGYANVRRYDDAKEIARLSLEAMPAMQPTLGNLLRRLESGGPSDAARDQFIEEMKVQRWREESCLNCLHGY